MIREATGEGSKATTRNQSRTIDRPTSVCRLSECVPTSLAGCLAGWLPTCVCVCVCGQKHDADGERLALFSTYLSIYT